MPQVYSAPLVLENVSLKPYNTFGIDVSARYFVEINHLQEYVQLLKEQNFIKNLVLSFNFFLEKNIIFQ